MMDLKFQEITLPVFVWYVMPGLNFVLTVIVLPILLIEPRSLSAFGNLGGGFLFLLLAVVLGFIMDSMKLYQLDRSYRNESPDFFRRIAEGLSTSEKAARELIDALRMGPMQIVFGSADYEEFNGLMLATQSTIDIGDGMITFEYTFSETTVNGKVDESIFEMPQ